MDMMALRRMVMAQMAASSNWTLIASEEFAINTTSTSTVDIGNVELPYGSYNSQEDIIWVHIRDKAGKRNGYVYGKDTFFLNGYIANGSTSSSSVKAYILLYVDSSGNYCMASSEHGVNANKITYTSTDHYIQIRARYSSTYGTINGTYKVDVYKLTPPRGMIMFE